MKDVEETLSNRVRSSPKKLGVDFTKDRVLWRSGDISEIPVQVKEDPLVGLLVKYYNSDYFRAKNFNDAVINKLRKSFEFLIGEVIPLLHRTPDNILFEFVRAVREKISNSDGTVWLYFTYITPPIFALGGRGKKGKKRQAALLLHVTFSEQELEVAQRICLKANVPRIKAPEHCAKKDVLDHFDLSCSGQELMVSLRTFSAWFISEWSEIRRRMRELCPLEVDLLSHYIAKKPERQDQRIRCQNLGDRKNYNRAIDIAFRIVKTVNHPMLTERFAVTYLSLQRSSTRYWSPSKALRNSYDFDKYVSRAKTINFIEVIENHCTHKAEDLGCHLQKFRGNIISRSAILKSSDWKGSLAGAMSITELLGLTPEEEICFAWLLSSDRHQPSNIARMTPEDIEETTTSLSTILNPQSLKSRSMRVAGSAYSSGELYKKNGLIFDAIKAYKKQLQFSYAEGYFNAEETARAILPRITTHSASPSLKWSHFRIHKTVACSLQLLLCAMPGSLSNEIAMRVSPKHKEWLNVMLEAATQSRADSNDSKFKTLACDYIQRQAVNNMLKRSISIKSIPISNNSDLSTASEEIEYIREVEAASQNHSVGVRSKVYLDNAPKSVLLAQSTKLRCGCPL